MSLDNILTKFKETHPNKQLILLYVAGSHFFDLNGPNSDMDYRGIYIDSYQDSFGPKNKKIKFVEYKTNERGGKNSSEDIDFTLYSLTSFLELLKKGDFNMVEALFAPENKILYKNHIYDELREFRRELIHNDTSSFLGFIKNEVNRIGVNSHHYGVQVKFLELLSGKPSHSKLSLFWPEIVKFCEDRENIGAKISKTRINNSGSTTDIPGIVIASRMHQCTASVGHTIEAIECLISQYGHRQKDAMTTGGDFKALYHVIRLIYEANDLLDSGELHFPLPSEQLEKLREIKYGSVNPDELFELVNTEIDKLIVRTQFFETNKVEREYRLDKMIFTIKGRLEISNRLKKYSLSQFWFNYWLI